MSQRAFRCQLCGSGLFRPVVVPRPAGGHYMTSFYECAGCSVMFIDPRAFNANEPGPPHSAGAQQAAAPPSMSLDTYGKPLRESASDSRHSGAAERPSGDKTPAG
jgi:hypothetical protein